MKRFVDYYNNEINVDEVDNSLNDFLNIHEHPIVLFHTNGYVFIRDITCFGVIKQGMGINEIAYYLYYFHTWLTF